MILFGPFLTRQLAYTDNDLGRKYSIMHISLD